MQTAKELEYIQVSQGPVDGYKQQPGMVAQQPQQGYQGHA